MPPATLALSPRSVALAAAVAAAALIDPCSACASPEHSGLCHSEKCRRQVLPQEKAPSWHRDAHSGMYFEAQIDRLEADAAVEKAKRRTARKIERAWARMADAMHGRATRTRHRTAA